jgi:hypothetical protein
VAVRKWADDFDCPRQEISSKRKDYESVVQLPSAQGTGRKAIPTTEHLLSLARLPLGAAGKGQQGHGLE